MGRPTVRGSWPRHIPVPPSNGIAGAPQGRSQAFVNGGVELVLPTSSFEDADKIHIKNARKIDKYPVKGGG